MTIYCVASEIQGRLFMEVEPRAKENRTNKRTVIIVFQERKHYSKKDPIIKPGVSQKLKVLYFVMINLSATLKLYFQEG